MTKQLFVQAMAKFFAGVLLVGLLVFLPAGTRMKVRMNRITSRGMRLLIRSAASSEIFREKNTLMNADTMVRLNTYPKSMVSRASRRRERVESKSSLSRVVKPQPVKREITWNRAFSSGRPVKRKSMANSSEMTQ